MHVQFFLFQKRTASVSLTVFKSLPHALPVAPELPLPGDSIMQFIIFLLLNTWLVVSIFCNG